MNQKMKIKVKKGRKVKEKKKKGREKGANEGLVCFEFKLFC